MSEVDRAPAVAPVDGEGENGGRPGIEAAIALAVEAHCGQEERNGQPYILHPLRVMFRVSSEVEQMAAVLHDVVEDTPYTLDDLRARGFPGSVIEAVDRLTRREGESYDAFVDRAAGDPVAHAVKLADLEDNMDIRRLPKLKDSDLDRLRRYRRAWDRLHQ